jgi:hypothetical protein
MLSPLSLIDSLSRQASLLSLAASLLVTSCGGGGGTGSVLSSTRLQGYFKDSSVAGLSYQTSSNVTGVTRPDGGFDYNPGDTIRFSFGAIQFPPVSAASLLTPLNMANGDANSPMLNNIAYLLQALDSDNDPENGITLLPEVAALANAAVASSIDFSAPTANFVGNAQLGQLIRDKDRTLNITTTTTDVSSLNHINWNLEQGFVDSTVIGPSVDCLYPNQGGASADIALVKRILASSNRTTLSPQLWADVYAKPQNAAGWFYGARYTLRSPNPTGAFEPYQPAANSTEVQAAMRSNQWHEYSSTYDAWFKHREEAKVQFRVASLKTYFGLVNQPEYIGNAIFLHYTGEPNTYLELVFLPNLKSTAYFNFTSSTSSTLYTSTLGPDGQLGGDDEGVFRAGQWAYHMPGDANFPPNLRLGGTTPAGRQIPDGTCLIPAGGSTLVWQRPSSRIDLFFSSIGVTVTGKGTAPLYNDARGYQGTVGVYSNENAIRLTVVKP